jgi:hypothetical protein
MSSRAWLRKRSSAAFCAMSSPCDFISSYVGCGSSGFFADTCRSSLTCRYVTPQNPARIRVSTNPGKSSFDTFEI